MTDKRRIALVGTAESRFLAPVSDPSWEIWGVGSRCVSIERATRWFELHRLGGEAPEWAANWRTEIKKFSHDCELMMLYPERDLGPKVTAYPHERIVARFGTYFMQSSFSWMMALAIDEMVPAGATAAPGACEVGVWGVDMEYGTEYREQRIGFRHFMALAQALGIAVSRLASSGLSYEPTPYPLIQDDPLLEKVAFRTVKTTRTLEQLDKTLRLTRGMIAQNRAVEAEIGRMGNGYDPEARAVEVRKETGNLLETSAMLSKSVVSAEAALEELAWLKDYLSP